ncbi:unnamed protein product [Phytophthora lilii]|uniref:DNA polymerase zeta catalytic subunit n=1 Tax=Phytophthora lilii TaxID=2077276 RepID=A0A9W6WN66_9STRA|nr:unnamed protein product [Phytophthora lilii]
MLPNPLHDPVNVISYSVEAQEGPTDSKTKERGFIFCKADDMEQSTLGSVGLCVDSSDISVTIATDERDLFCSLEKLVRRWDPDFLAGFEVQKASIGYLVDRASQMDSLSRLPSTPIDPRNITSVPDREGESQNEASIGTTWGVNKAAGLWLHGRCRLKDGLNPELETSLGVVDFTPSASGLLHCKDDIIIAPNGTLFCPKSYRYGVLPLILDEILSTRIMVKKSMKSAKESNQNRLERVLNARQLALKMISNVTYGYTAAGFSGRMPCAQLADAIVQFSDVVLVAVVADWIIGVFCSAPPAALVSTKAMAKDPRAEPRYAERVPYVVVNGPPGARLMDLVVSPDEYFDKRKRYSVNYHYYINKQVCSFVRYQLQRLLSFKLTPSALDHPEFGATFSADWRQHSLMVRYSASVVCESSPACLRCHDTDTSV